MVPRKSRAVLGNYWGFTREHAQIWPVTDGRGLGMDGRPIVAMAATSHVMPDKRKRARNHAAPAPVD